MKALSIRQPWADAIMAGWKTVENRTWDTAHRGTLAVHTGLTLARLPHDLGGQPGPTDYLPELTRQLAMADNAPGDRVVGHVIGTVRLVDIHTAASCRGMHVPRSPLGAPTPELCSPWALPEPGPYAKRSGADMFHWVFAGQQRIDPVMTTGSLQLFDVELPD